ncbi:MAG: response regulator [Granulosicoccus sp.]
MSRQYKIKTMMIVDDSAIDQLLYRRIIGRSGIVENIIAFQSAIEALAYLKLLERDEIDVILLDINMPLMNGFEFLEQLSDILGSEFAACVVIMLTTSLDPADEARANEFEAVRAYLNKPLTIEDLENVAGLLTQ